MAGEKQGLVRERLFNDGETLLDGSLLDIDTEMRLANDLKRKLDVDVNLSYKDMKRTWVSPELDTSGGPTHTHSLSRWEKWCYPNNFRVRTTSPLSLFDLASSPAS